MNPPFISWGGLSADQRNQLKRVLGKRYSGRPDYSMGFISRAVSTLRPGGVVGTLVPASILSVGASLAWRKHLLEVAGIQFLGVLGDYSLFRHALVEIACLVMSKDGEREGSPIIALWAGDERGSAGEVLRQLRKVARPIIRGATDSLSRSGNNWRISTTNARVLRESPDWRPRPNRLEQVFSRLLQSSTAKVRELFHVREGIRAGARKIFMISESEYLSLPKGEQPFFRPVVENRNIVQGRIESHEYIFYPYTPSVPQIHTEEDLRALVPVYFARHLLPNRETLSHRKALRGRDWWHLNWPRNYFNKPIPKLVSAFFGDAGSFALDVSGEYVVVQGFAWFARPNLRDAIDSVPIAARDEYRNTINHAYQALLNSRPFSLLLAEFCPHVAGGQYNLSKRFVDPIPLPNLAEIGQQSAELGSLVSSLAEQGQAIRGGEPISAVRVDGIVAELYGAPITLWPIQS